MNNIPTFANDSKISKKKQNPNKSLKTLKFPDFKLKQSKIKRNMEDLKSINRYKESRGGNYSSKIDKSINMAILPQHSKKNKSISILRSIERSSNIEQAPGNITNNPIISFKINIPGFDILKPKILRPFLNIVSEDEIQLRETFEKL